MAPVGAVERGGGRGHFVLCCGVWFRCGHPIVQWNGPRGRCKDRKTKDRRWEMRPMFNHPEGGNESVVLRLLRGRKVKTASTLTITPVCMH